MPGGRAPRAGRGASALGQLGWIRETVPAPGRREDHPQRPTDYPRVVGERAVPHVHGVHRELDGEQPRRIGRLRVVPGQEPRPVGPAEDASGDPVCGFVRWKKTAVVSSFRKEGFL